MATLVSVRTLSRAKNVRVKNADGERVTLSPTESTVVDLDDTETRRRLGDHISVGNVIVSGTTVPSYALADRPAAADVPAGTIIFVPDGGAGAVFQGSTGAAWVNLG